MKVSHQAESAPRQCCGAPNQNTAKRTLERQRDACVVPKQPFTPWNKRFSLEGLREGGALFDKCPQTFRGCFNTEML
jgi:hypothetical protein